MCGDKPHCRSHRLLCRIVEEQLKQEMELFLSEVRTQLND